MFVSGWSLGAAEVSKILHSVSLKQAKSYQLQLWQSKRKKKLVQFLYINNKYKDLNE